jgi:proline dehydrogenase
VIYMKVLKFIKDNFFAMFALIGAFIAAFLSFGSSGSDKIAALILKNKKKSDKEKLKVFQDKITRVKEFQVIYDNIIAEAEEKEEKLTEEQNIELEKRREEYFNANTPESRQKVVDDIKKNFKDLNFVPLDSIADVEDNDD